MSQKPFEQFINKKITGAKKKELIKQEKRKAKAERAERYRNPNRYGIQDTRRQPIAGLKQRQQETGSNKQETLRGKYEAPAAMHLNKFIAHAGVCGRREAALLIKDGFVTINDKPVLEPGTIVSEKDMIKLKGKTIHIQKDLVYILLNKPKDYITSASDPQGRKTVYDLLKSAVHQRVFPVGRLDRNTTGILLMTNDGELAQKLTHPSFEIKKIYEVKLDKPVEKNDIQLILKGIMLEDGLIKADAIAYADAKDKSLIGIEIHSGRNRIVRRIFEQLGYDVRSLDRVMFANLTKKNVQRGKWRFLNEKEVRLLKYMNQSFVKQV